VQQLKEVINKNKCDEREAGKKFKERRKR